MKKSLKRTLSLALAVLMTVLVIPFSTLIVSADGSTALSLPETEPEGEATYYINSVSDWYTIRGVNHPSDTTKRWTWDNKTVVLNADLDFGGAEAWRLFYEFHGTFDGNGHTIKNATTNGYQFFAFWLEGATIKDVTFQNITHSYSRSDEGGNGLIAGDVAGNSSASFINVCVDNCTTSASGSNTWNYGFLLGRLQNNASLTIKDCVIKNSKIGADSNRVGIAVGKMNGNCNVDGLQVLDCEFTKGNSWASYGIFAEVCTNCAFTASNIYASGIKNVATKSNAVLIGSADTGTSVDVKNSVFSADNLSVIAETGKITHVKFDTCIFDMNNASVLNSVGKNNNLVEVITNNCVTTSDNLKQVNALTTGTTITLNEGIGKTADDSILKVSKERAAEMFTRNDKGFITKVDGHISVNYAQDTTGGTAVAAGGNYSVRFIAVSQIATPKNAGMTIVVKNHDTGAGIYTYTTNECDTYDKLIGYEGIDEYNYQASEFNAEKFMAVIIAGIPAGTAYDFVITPHYETEGGVVIKGQTVTASYGADGIFVNN